MENKPLTQMEFFSIPEDDITRADKELIEKQVLEIAGSKKESPNIPACMAMRGYLAKMWLDAEPDDDLREDAGMMAACFIDGWNWRSSVKRNTAEDPEEGME